MLEKNSSVILTRDEITQIANGNVPGRLSATWGFTLEQLRDILDEGNYTIASWTHIDPDTEGPHT